jgi:hypothetical protein
VSYVFLEAILLKSKGFYLDMNTPSVVERFIISV